jgi:hypothetical protein
MTHENPRHDPEAIFAALERDDAAGARALCRAAFERGVPEGSPERWARACEGVGLSMLALQVWQTCLARNPGDAHALTQLARLHDERGDAARAAACRAKLARPGAAPGLGAEGASMGDGAREPEPGLPGDGDLARFVSLFGGRAGVHARQWHERERGGGYSPVAAPLGPELVRAHLEGGVTLGAYLVRHDNTSAQLVFDLDARKEAVSVAWGHRDKAADLRRRIHEAGLSMLRGLRDAGFDPVLEDSGFKGRHLWCFLPEPEPAARVRALGQAWARVLAPRDPDLEVEVFPKQDVVPPGGLGNLVKLPLGIHKATDRRCLLLDDEGRPLRDPWERLRRVRRVALDDVRPPPPVLVPNEREPSYREKSREPTPLPAPAVEPRPPFSEADFEARPRLSAVLASCQPIREAVRRALVEKHLGHDARVVLEHTLGHFPEGVEAVNYLVDRCGGAAEERMGNPHRGSPSSCARVKARLAAFVDPIDCACVFPKGDGYPTPNLHAEGVAAEAPAPAEPVRPLEELLDALGRLDERWRRLGAELDTLRGIAARRLAELPGGRYEDARGTWLVEDHEGIPGVVYKARSA